MEICLEAKVLATANGQKSAEAIVVAEMSDEGPNPCDCEMNQNAQAANVAKQKTKDSYLSDQSRNGGEEMEELSSQPWRKSNNTCFRGRNHLILNPNLK